MVLKFLAHGAAINVLAKLHRVEMNVVDVGVDAHLDGIDGLLNCKVRKGTRNMLHEAAMSDAELAQALEVGSGLAAEARAKGQSLLAVGEMGIGNTTPAQAIPPVLTTKPSQFVTLKET